MMKRNLAKILVLVLIISLLAPAMANAADYRATLKLSDGTKSCEADPTNYLADSSKLSELFSSADLREKASATFPGVGLSAKLDSILTADADEWKALIESEEIVIEPAAAADVLVDRNCTLGALAAVATQVTAKFVHNEVTYTLTLNLTAYVPDTTPTTPTVTPTPEPEEEEPVVVDGSDVTEEEPLVVEEPVTVADSAEEATEIQIENIPEEVTELDVEVALTGAETAEGEAEEVSENTTVLAVKYTDEDGNEAYKIIPMAIIEIDEAGNITAKGSLNEELTALLKDGGSLVAYDNEQPVFTDVAEAVADGTVTQEEADAVAYWQARDVIEGVGGGELGDLEEEVDRARFVTFLHRAFGEPAPEAEADYADLNDPHYSYAKDAASWAAEAGLMNGIGLNENGEAEFGTGEIKLWQMALIMYRALGYSDNSENYVDSWNWAVENGLILGAADDAPDMPAVCLMMQRLAELLDGARMEGDSTLETPALDAAG